MSPPHDEFLPDEGPDDTERREIALEVTKRHREGLTRRRLRDLTAEKYLVHVDGTNDGQWAEIVDGQSVIVPPNLGSNLRLQRNLLRPLVDNMVAYHTANPLRVVADVPPGRRARDRARVATLLANHIIQTQRLNGVLAEAMYVAAIYGHCPVHVTWRDDVGSDVYRSPYADPEAEGIVPGYADIWVGDPWSTVYDEGATRNSVHRISYEKILPETLVKQRFAHIPEVENIRGAEGLPSVSRFQRIMREWEYLGNSTRAGAAVTGDHTKERHVALICEEVAPGLDPEWPEGKLTIVAVNGAYSMDRRHGRAEGADAVLLHEGPLPAGRFSSVRFYAVNRYDDVLGKPYVEDLDDLQIQLNQVVTMRAERLKRYSMPQLMAKAGSIDEDTIVADPDSIMWVSSHEYPEFLKPPQGNPDYDAMIQEIESQIFRIGGWQAASRGEANAGDPAAKVVALAKADDTVFGPMNRAFQESAVQLIQTAHALYKRYSDLPTMAVVAGEEFEYAVEPWIRNEDLGDEPPNFRIVSGFGASPEALAQTLQNMVVMAGADGSPLLTTTEFWERYPDASLKPHRPNPEVQKRKRLVAVNYYLEQLASESETQYQNEVNQSPQLLPQLAQFIAQEVETVYPLLRTEDPQQAIVALDELIHDTTVSPLCRMAAEIRQSRYFMWLAQIMAQQGAGGVAAGMPPSAAQGSGSPPGSSPFGGTPNSNAASPNSLRQEVSALTSAASAGNLR